MARPGVMFYFDIRPCIKRLSLEEKGQLFEAILDYGEYGAIPEVDGVLGIAWDFIQPKLDLDAERYDTKVEQKRYATFVREVKKRGETPMPFDEWKQLSDTERSQVISADIGRYPTTTSNSTSTTTSTNNIGADKPPTPVRKEFSRYGWVKLTQEEYDRLVADLGETEAKRCIDYIDEAAQSTRNKNKWKDWNLVVRRCHRDGWGKNTPPQGGRGSQMPDYGGADNWSL